MWSADGSQCGHPEVLALHGESADGFWGMTFSLISLVLVPLNKLIYFLPELLSFVKITDPAC